MKVFTNEIKWKNLKAVIETNSEGFQNIMIMNKVKIGWNIRPVREYVNINLSTMNRSESVPLMPDNTKSSLWEELPSIILLVTLHFF